jgi:hypothetical protein
VLVFYLTLLLLQSMCTMSVLNVQRAALGAAYWRMPRKSHRH